MITLTLLASLLPAPQDPPATTPITAVNGQIKLDVPADWQLKKPRDFRPVKALPNKHHARCVPFDFHLKSPKTKSSAYFKLIVLTGSRARPLCEAWYDSVGWKGNFEKIDVLHEPTAHVIGRDGNDVQVRAYKVIEHRAFYLNLECRDQQDWLRLRDEFFTVLSTLKLEGAPTWLPSRKGRRETVKKGICISAGKEVNTRQIRALRRVADKVHKYYHAHFPAVPWSDQYPFVVFVNATAQGHAAVNAGQVPPAVCVDNRGRMMYTLPIEKIRSDPDDHYGSRFAQFLFMSMLAEHFPEEGRIWFAFCAWTPLNVSLFLGKDLPYVTKKALSWGLADHRFDEFATSKPTRRHSGSELGYQTLFLLGPKKYQKAYAAFLEDFRRTGNQRAATEKHLLSLDQEKMQKDLRVLIKKKLRVARRRRR